VDHIAADKLVLILDPHSRAGVSYALEETLCGDTICGTYGTEPSFDDDNRPPDGKALGRCEFARVNIPTSGMILEI
jgi:hypothetical protein